MQKLWNARGRLLAVLAGGVLAACGGGGDDGGDGGGGVAPPPSGGGTVLTAGVGGLTGDWLANGCSAAGGQSFKNLARVTRLSDTSIGYASGVMSYANATCSGTGSLIGPSNMGTVVFSRSESNTAVAANWGTFTTVTSTTSAAIWAKKSETVLCLLGDENPSILPTLSQVASTLAVQPDSACYTRQP